jgi:hypothetical protein
MQRTQGAIAMNTCPSVHHNETNREIAALCRLTGLSPEDVAAILAEITNDDLRAYRAHLLADALPSLFSAYLSGGYTACAAPDVWPGLVRACVASFCCINGLKPSLLAPIARRNAGGLTGIYAPTPEDAAAMMYELDDLTARAVRF